MILPDSKEADPMTLYPSLEENTLKASYATLLEAVVLRASDSILILY